MYWDNCWLSFFNKNFFLNKTLFLENLFVFLFTERIFYNFFKDNFLKEITKKKKFKFFLIRCNKFSPKTFEKNLKKIKYNFSKIWFIKYNNYILISFFCFFYFSVQRIKKTKYERIPDHTIKIVMMRRKGSSFKKSLKKLRVGISLFF